MQESQPFFINLMLTKEPPSEKTISSLFIVSLKLNTMNVNIQTVRFSADSKRIDYVNRKLEKLSHFTDRIIQVNVFLKLDNVVHAVKDKIAEIRVQIPRHSFFVKSTSKSFEESFDEALDSLVVQIKKNKQKKAA